MNNSTKSIIILGGVALGTLGALYAWSVAIRNATEAAPREDGTQGSVTVTMEPTVLAQADITLQRDITIPPNAIVGVLGEEWQSQDAENTRFLPCTLRAATGLWLAAEPGEYVTAHYAGIPLAVNAGDVPVPTKGTCERGTMIVVPATYLETGDLASLVTLLDDAALPAKVAEMRDMMRQTTADWDKLKSGELPVAPDTASPTQ